MILALTREISAAIVQCELTHLAREPLDVGRAREEHAAYEDALRALGCTVEQLPADDTMPDSVFIEDTAVVLDEVAIITRPGAESRRVETHAVAERLAAERPLIRITGPATLDGGDVLVAGRRVFVGVGARTNVEGFTQVRAALEPHGYGVHSVPFQGCLHLKSAATVVADDLLLVNPAWVDPGCLGPLRTLDVHPDEPFAGNALRLGGFVVHGLEFSRTRARLERAGLHVRPVAAGELAKAEGGVTCCALLLQVGRSPD